MSKSIILDVPSIMEEAAEHLREVQQILVEETKDLQPIAFILTISDGSEMYAHKSDEGEVTEYTPAGDYCKLFISLADWMGATPSVAVEELLEGLRDEGTLDVVRDGPFLSRTLEGLVEDDDPRFGDALESLLKYYSKTSSDIISYGLARNMKETGAFAVVVSFGMSYRFASLGDAPMTKVLSEYRESEGGKALTFYPYRIEDEVLHLGEPTPMDLDDLVNFMPPLMDFKDDVLLS